MQKLERRDVYLKEGPAGNEFALKVYQLVGNKAPGPHVYIQASVHGAELQGNAVIYELMKHLTLHSFKGALTFVPCANPSATGQKMGTYTYGRFNPNSGDNWNRLYVDLLQLQTTHSLFNIADFVETHIKSSWEEIKQEYKKLILNTLITYEQKFFDYGPRENGRVNIELQKLSASADIVLDLHTGPKACRYLYAAEYEQAKACDLNFPHNLIIPNEFAGAMDEASFMPWYALYQAFQAEGRQIPLNFEAYTIELGDEEVIELASAKTDALKILNYLNKRGLQIDEVETLESSDQYACVLKDYKSYYAPFGGLVDYCLKPGDHFKKGDVLARFLNFNWMQGQALNPQDSIRELKALADGIVINHCPSSAVNQGMLLFQVMEQVKKW